MFWNTKTFNLRSVPRVFCLLTKKENNTVSKKERKKERKLMSQQNSFARFSIKKSGYNFFYFVALGNTILLHSWLLRKKG